ncbi:MAG: hypothetical protein IKQ46_12245 [Bacteroidales bacterium]|nr:hypothetical protein [Bacteroidales bacterium]
MAAKTTIGIIIFILAMSVFLTLYKIIKSEDEKINPWYLFCALLVSIGAATAAFILFEN